ncbi:MAG TPA: carboxypeptidase regulatory-like domain-containing protein [Edaphobacter sp.]|nr:carboxypeptidase regulatory-like domain-containing protein [Edaphobacter sp.]
MFFEMPNVSCRLVAPIRADLSQVSGLPSRRLLRPQAFCRASLRLLIALLSLATPLAAQSFGSISGNVTDTSGAVVPNSLVTATQTKTGAKTSVNTNGSGSYVFPAMGPAEYSITASAAGFQRYIQSGIVLLANQAATVNIALQIGAITETVSVQANAVQVDTTTGTLSQVVDQKNVNELPLNGRNAAALTTLVAGVVSAPSDGTDKGNTKTFPAAVPISANGSRSDQTNYLLDGGNNTDEYTMANGPFPFPDALQEFSVQTSNYNAEFGQSAGAVVNIVTKSGEHQFHGNAFEYLRNGMFNARNYFASSVDPLKRHQFGVTIGGPVKIPYVTHGDHTFFFFGYQRTNLKDQVGGSSAFVPTPANLTGDFSALLSASNPANPQGKVIKIIDPTTNQPFSNNQIPTGRLDQAALNFAKELPAGAANGLVFYAVPLVEFYNEYIARVDHDLTTRDHIFGHYYYNYFKINGTFDPTNLLTYKDGANIRYQSALISESHTFTPNLLNNLIINYTRDIAARQPEKNAQSVADFGVNIWQPTLKAIQQVSVGGFFSMGDAPTAVFERNNYTLSDDVHYVKGNHNIAFGVHLELTKNDINNLYQQPGLFSFNATNTNYAAASFVMGYLSSFTQGNGQYFGNRATFAGYYVQDSWKVNRRFTLNYGIRYEPFYPYNEVFNRLEQFNAGNYAAGVKSTVYPNAPAGLIFPGDHGMPEDGVNPIYTNFMPRIGFNFDVFGDQKTILRGGGGIFYDTRQPGIQNTPASDVTPFSIALTLTQPKGPFSNPYLGTTNPFPALSPPPSNTTFPSPVTAFTFNPKFPIPVTNGWNLTVEQQFTHGLVSRLAYVGSDSSHLFTSVELNPAVYNGSNTSADTRRLYPGFSNIVETNMGGNSSYHSLQATLQQQLAHGVSFLLNYTFSKSLDNLPYASNNSFAQPGQSYVLPIYVPNYKRLDRGLSDFDLRNNVSFSYLWALPSWNSAPRGISFIINGWNTSGIVQLASGRPLTITSSADLSGTGLLKDRAVEVPNMNPYGKGACGASSGSCVNWINPTAFATPSKGMAGNVQKGSREGPGLAEWDTGLQKYFNITERYRFQFRAEYFNVLNHTNLLAPVTGVSSAGFGSVKSASDPRIAQLALKFLF